MATFLTAKGVTYAIEQIIRNAKVEVGLISPFVKISETLLQSLREANRRELDITLVYGKKDLDVATRSQLAQLENVTVYYLENLHAKCYFNEQSMVITSLNLYDFSEQNNREMGILIDKTNDPVPFSEALREIVLIIGEARKVQQGQHERLPPELQSKHGKKSQTSDTYRNGRCIRCGMPIPHNTMKPFCDLCYRQWSQYLNSDYPECFCHTCGKPATTFRDQPECYSCFQKAH